MFIMSDWLLDVKEKQYVISNIFVDGYAVISVKNIIDNLLKYLVDNATPFLLLFHRLVLRRVHFTYSTVILLGGCMVVWTWSGLEACLFWSFIDIIVVRIKVSRGIEPFFPVGIDRCGHYTVVNRPMGRFAWTNHIYFLKTQPGSSTVTHLYQRIILIQILLQLYNTETNYICTPDVFILLLRLCTSWSYTGNKLEKSHLFLLSSYLASASHFRQLKQACF
jgi:hypothetical protein